MASDSSRQADVELHAQCQESTSAAPFDVPTISASASEHPEPEVGPRQTCKLFSAGFSFFVAGVNDGSMGALLPYILREFHIGTSFVAIL
jgi:hypothetical protein